MPITIEVIKATNGDSEPVVVRALGATFANIQTAIVYLTLANASLRAWHGNVGYRLKQGGDVVKTLPPGDADQWDTDAVPGAA